MVVYNIQDIYNKEKVWVVKKYKCGHYYFSQKICGKYFYTRFAKTTLKHIKQIGLILN